MVDPIDYGAPLRASILSGLQGGALLQGIGLRSQAMEQARQGQLMQQQFTRDWQEAYSSGDPSAMEAIIAKYPEQMETVQKAIGFRDDNHRVALGNAARDLRIAAQNGDSSAFTDIAARYEETLRSVGSSSDEISSLYQNDPQKTMQIIDTVGMGALGVKDYYSVRNEQDKNSLARSKLDMENARGWAGLNQQAQNHADDMMMKKLGYQQQQLQNQYENSNNQLKQQELQQKIDANKDAQLQRQQVVVQSKNDMYTAQKLAEELAADPNLDNIVGTVTTADTGWLSGTFRSSSADKISKAKQLQGLLSTERLKAFKGSTSDKDLEMAYQLATGLRLTDNGIKGSPNTVRKQLKQLSAKLKTSLKGYIPDYVQADSQPQEGSPDGVYTTKSGIQYRVE